MDAVRQPTPRRCLVTAGPTYEPLDAVRRLTNFSTGRLGTELAVFLTQRGHHVKLLLGEQAVYAGERNAAAVVSFGTTADLREQLQRQKSDPVEAVFHAAAVSDFQWGAVWIPVADGTLQRVTEGKISTRAGRLLAELIPTTKIIAELRGWFPHALLVGWKYEVDGDRTSTLDAARRQLEECQTDACVVNGPAYGTGFGLLTRKNECWALRDRTALFSALQTLLES
ncbi:MAG TPA: phosphopantothenoylcysteine decarboxylase [Verrucomicrobiota bacterium]|nr:MAG: bifunctional phosphopantothenoylcysteine decarboxylase/phosphopantothenate synthase [Verrucomicrobia bacterium ADurb.Bin118]HPY30882.1 phosphopantothenoylcysteine decarboxylase [Verrucomicrobiota bacterium]HQB17256.1 phosphopantothenoylcysteine decarboxylase [Verrucomicrobiota bacterium]